jgi:gamma-tubulin complex component 2
MNHYFFFDRGDFFTHFIDGCQDILEKFTSEVKTEKLKLEPLLEMAIQTSSAASDPFKDDVSCELSDYGVAEQNLVTCLTKGALGPDAFSSSVVNQMEVQNPML